MSRNQYDVLIVGAGHGGAQTALSLRQLKFAGTITLLGDGPDPPYERPALSKTYLAQERTFDRILLQTSNSWASRSIRRDMA